MEILLYDQKLMFQSYAACSSSPGAWNTTSIPRLWTLWVFEWSKTNFGKQRLEWVNSICASKSGTVHEGQCDWTTNTRWTDRRRKIFSKIHWWNYRRTWRNRRQERSFVQWVGCNLAKINISTFITISAKHKIKKMFIPMLIILKLFKLKLLLFLPFILGITGLKKILGLAALIVPGKRQ